MPSEAPALHADGAIKRSIALWSLALRDSVWFDIVSSANVEPIASERPGVLGHCEGDEVKYETSRAETASRMRCLQAGNAAHAIAGTDASWH
ncbi:hypothetical protein CHGG_07783 [Chaetomium globosum CBS 148.51]|uniref:Uncharacterized protein n=1 Tax=Chaetomium globosum (strain ATCC 6205 / CBS 148.51 / DSM 1962 / NBRC 6347 / NRRL 1970) TaxID=306901 RepID=Q2GW71_CHAGB|nr:uncharacterized protein CHGG_07783 [Chaetomium globosum CBS 148.51]EAQ86530.1 hypothetical protein CHGG_07783 [Chaetomium globosum CBS 148.51]